MLMPRQWLINYPARKAPMEKLPEHPVFDTWRKHVGPILPNDGDYEHFAEEAFRLHAALQSFGLRNSWLHHQWGDYQGKAFNIATGECRPADELKAEGAAVYGAQPSFHHRVLAGEPADNYAPLRAFQRNAGRYVELGGFNTEQEDDFDLVFQRMYERGIRKALLKRRHRKSPLLEVDLKTWKSEASVIRAMIDDDAGWSLINDEGVRAAYLVQEYVPMRYEYRTFIIGHTPVTGAGCVEEFTPLDNSGEAFDDMLREARSQGTILEKRPDVRDTLLEFSKDVAEQIAIESPGIGGYTLDTALDQNGNPLVIELNGHLNAGFFASQPQRITDALLSSTIIGESE